MNPFSHLKSWFDFSEECSSLEKPVEGFRDRGETVRGLEGRGD